MDRARPNVRETRRCETWKVTHNSVAMSQWRVKVMAFFQGLLEHAGVEGQFGDEVLEAVILGLEF